jgi:hypothetical protein
MQFPHKWLAAGLSKKVVPQTGQKLSVINLIFSLQSGQNNCLLCGCNISAQPRHRGGKIISLT